MSRSPELREAFGYCDETCPAVEGAFDDLASGLMPLIAANNQGEAQKLLDACCEAVKDKATLRLRDALVEACRDKQEIESDRDRCAEELRDLNAQVSSLQAEVRELESQMEAA